MVFHPFVTFRRMVVIFFMLYKITNLHQGSKHIELRWSLRLDNDYNWICSSITRFPLYADTEKHYSDEQHQLLLVQYLKQILQQPSSELTASQKQINQQYCNQLMASVQHIETEMQSINRITGESVSIATTQNTIKTRLLEMCEQLARMQELFGNTQVISDINQIIVEISDLFTIAESYYVIELQLMGLDDVFTWKIDSLLLLANNLPTLDSVPFQSSRWGYRMKIGISVKIDEKTKIRCVLLSFTIIRGEYDPILFWPFSYPLTFCLVDLAGTKKHILKSVVPDSQEAIFGRPCSDANKPYCIDEFCQFDALIDAQSRFIRDQSMFLKLHIDFTSHGLHPFWKWVSSKMWNDSLLHGLTESKKIH